MLEVLEVMRCALLGMLELWRVGSVSRLRNVHCRIQCTPLRLAGGTLNNTRLCEPSTELYVISHPHRVILRVQLLVQQDRSFSHAKSQFLPALHVRIRQLQRPMKPDPRLDPQRDETSSTKSLIEYRREEWRITALTLTILKLYFGIRKTPPMKQEWKQSS